MNDVKDLLQLALTDSHEPAGSALVDPSGDLARGRALLRRRRLGTGAAAAAVTTVIGAAALVPFTVGAGRTASPRAPGGTVGSAIPGSGTGTPGGAPTGSTPGGRLPAVALVAYQGEQPPGYRVSQVPAGWVIQGGNAFALTIAPKDSPDKHIDSFAGKLVVMLGSADAPPPGTSGPGTGYQEVEVNGQPGVFHVEDGTPAAPPTTGICSVPKAGAEREQAAMRRQWATLSPARRLKLKSEWLTSVPCASVAVPTASATPDPDFVPTQVLVYRLADGRQMVIQAPVSLGWDAARLVRFAAGIQVLPGARQGRG